MLGTLTITDPTAYNHTFQTHQEQSLYLRQEESHYPLLVISQQTCLHLTYSTASKVTEIFT